ncbi:MAG: phosphoribosylanthranilate isomerase [Trueperaceae bacterium]
MNHLRIKVCGITREVDAEAAERAGADAVGFVFAKASKRHVSIERAAELAAALGPFVVRVGVFVDAPLHEVQRAVEVAGLDAVQLHGTEDAAFAASVARRTKVIRALSFAPDVTPAALATYPAAAVLLDASAPGSGQTFAWHEARDWRGHPRLVLAGGLNPGNVAAAVAALNPYGVDVSSGVETAPGIKSEALIRRFVEAARGAAT